MVSASFFENLQEKNFKIKERYFGNRWSETLQKVEQDN